MLIFLLQLIRHELPRKVTRELGLKDSPYDDEEPAVQLIADPLGARKEKLQSQVSLRSMQLSGLNYSMLLDLCRQSNQRSYCVALLISPHLPLAPRFTWRRELNLCSDTFDSRTI